MGKFDKLAKFLGLATEKYGDDAAKIIEKVPTAELAVSLPPTQRGEYIQALNEIYGDEAKRRELTGHKVPVFTGTNREIRNLDPNKNKRAMFGPGTYTTSNPEMANFYAKGETGNVMPLYTKEGKYLDINKGEKLNDELIDRLIERMGKDKYSPDDLEAIKNYFKSFSSNQTQEIELLDKFYDGDIVKLGKDLSKEGILGSKYTTPTNDVMTIIKDPANMRSKFAAFDPRFKDSPLLMAGVAAVPQVDVNPISAIKQGLGYYEQAKEAVTKPLAQQLNLSKNPEDEATFNNILKVGLDPVNLVPGVSGAGLGAIQALTPSEEDMKIQALKKLSNREK